MRIKPILKMLKKKSSLKQNIKIHQLAYVANSKFGGHNYIDRFCKIRNSFIGKYSYVGFGSDFNKVTVGNYCSISSDVKIGLGNHPTHLFSSSPVFYSDKNPLNIKEAYLDYSDSPKQTIIENDVWIGANAIIMDGVHISNGAVIAAGAIVTKNVGPYEIVGGVPAKLIKKRFNDKTIESLLKSEWWHKSPKQLKESNFRIEDLLTES